MNNFNPNNINREKILERKYFHQLPRKTQRELMEYWRENFPTSVIREKMGYNSGTAFYNLLKRLKLPTNVQRVRIEDDFLEDDFLEEDFLIFLSVEVSQNLIGFGVPNGGIISAYRLAEVASLAVSLISGLATIHAPALPALALGENSNFVHCFILLSSFVSIV